MDFDLLKTLHMRLRVPKHFQIWEIWEKIQQSLGKIKNMHLDYCT